MVLKRPLQTSNGFWGDHHHWMFFGGLTIAINGFSVVFVFCYHHFQWFSMVQDHWSNDAMVSMDRCGLICSMCTKCWKEYIMFKVKSGLLGLSTNDYNSVYIPKQLQKVPFLEASFRAIFCTIFCTIFGLLGPGPLGLCSWARPWGPYRSPR